MLISFVLFFWIVDGTRARKVLRALADLYLSSAKLWKLDGCTWVTITCKDARKCAQWRPGNAQPLIEFYVNTPEEAQQVLNLLKELAPFYPEGAAH